MELLAEVIAALVQLILDIIYTLLTAIFTSTYIAARTKGIARFASVGAVLAGIYLLIAFLRGFIPALASPSFSPYFSGFLASLAIIILIFFLFVPFAIRAIEQREERPSENATANFKVPHLLIYLFVTAVIFGALAIWSETTRAPTMEERFCSQIQQKLGSERITDVNKGIGALGKLINRDISLKIPCQSPDQTN